MTTSAPMTKTKPNRSNRMTKMVRVSDLSPHPRLGADLLPRLTADEYEGLRASIKEWGIMQSIVYADPEMVIIDGHNRWQIAKELGLDEVPCVPESFADEAARLRLGVSLNADRRQLSREQKRSVVAEILKADPEQSDRLVARAVGVSHPTVAKVREAMEGAGDVEKVSTRTDSVGRKQPARKPSPTDKAVVENIQGGRVPRPRPVPRRVKDFIAAAVSLGDVGMKDVAEVGVNRSMAEGLENAQDVIVLLLEAGTKKPPESGSDTRPWGDEDIWCWKLKNLYKQAPKRSQNAFRKWFDQQVVIRALSPNPPTKRRLAHLAMDDFEHALATVNQVVESAYAELHVPPLTIHMRDQKVRELGEAVQHLRVTRDRVAAAELADGE